MKLFSLKRSLFEEISVHGDISVFDGSKVVFQTSQPSPRYPARSLLKPFQFFAGGLPDERWVGNTEHNRYAPCAGSIVASTEQVEAITGWYRKGKPKALLSHLKVVPVLPGDATKRVQVQQLGTGPKQIYHPCFSKHVGILEACEYHGWDPSTYLSPEHPFHQRLLKELSQLLAEDLSEVPCVTDGCGLPSPVLSLDQMARLYHHLLVAPSQSRLWWIGQMMLKSPNWVGGPGSIDTQLMEKNPGKLIAKIGADGLLALGVVSDAKPMSLILKINHGLDNKAMAQAVAPILEYLGLVPVQRVPKDQAIHYFYRPFEPISGVIDISPVVGPDTAVWPGDVAFHRHESLSVEEGNNFTLSDIKTTVHIGAHTDAPNHFGKGAGGIDTVLVDSYVGPCQVMSVSRERGTLITPEDLQDITSARVLFKTGSFPDPKHFNEDFVALAPETIELLHQKGVVLVGVDTPSIDNFSSKALLAHHACLKTGMAILEGIVLDNVSDGAYELIAAPLKLKDADASPVRALLRPL